MKISLILPAYHGYPIGGYRVVYEYANYLAGVGHEVTVIYPRNLGKYTKLSGIEAFKRALWPYKMRLKNRPLVGWMPIDYRINLKLAGNFDSESVPDGNAVIATGWQTAKPVANLPLSKGKKLYLVQDHEVWHGATSEAVDSTFGLGLSVVAISNWLVDLAKSCGAEDVRYIPNGLDHQKFRVLNDPSARQLRVLALYHLDSRKDIGTAISALELIHSLRPDIPVTMFGVPKRGDEIPSWVTYERSPSSERLLQLYNENSIFLSASKLEGWCLPAIEAMACGCTFIGTDSKGPRDFATHNVSTLFSAPKDAQALADNLQRVICDQQLRTRLQAAGTKSAQQFTWEKAGAALVEAILSK